MELGKSAKLEIEGVDANECHDVEDVEEEPDEQHQDVVREDHVIDDSFYFVK